MQERQVRVQIPDGLHLRPAQELCQLAGEYEAHSELRCRGRTVNAKSLLGVLSASIQYGEEVILRSSGADEEQAVSALEEFLNREN